MNDFNNKWLHVMIGVLLLIGLFSLVYYILIISYAGIYTGFTWFWIGLGVSSLMLSLALYIMSKNQIVPSKPIQLIVMSVFLVGMGIFIILEGIIIYSGNHKPNKNAQYMIVLGAQVRGTKPSRALSKRLDMAISYLKENETTVVIVSGGQGKGEDVSEARAMKTYLVNKGINGTRILEEDKSTDTNENIDYSKELMKGENNSVIIVSNKFHIFRATSIARKKKIGKVEGLGASTDDILVVSYYFREVLAVVKDKLVGNF